MSIITTPLLALMVLAVAFAPVVLFLVLIAMFRRHDS